MPPRRPFPTSRSSTTSFGELLSLVSPSLKIMGDQVRLPFYFWSSCMTSVVQLICRLLDAGVPSNTGPFEQLHPWKKKKKVCPLDCVPCSIVPITNISISNTTVSVDANATDILVLCGDGSRHGACMFFLISSPSKES